MVEQFNFPYSQRSISETHNCFLRGNFSVLCRWLSQIINREVSTSSIAAKLKAFIVQSCREILIWLTFPDSRVRHAQKSLIYFFHKHSRDQFIYRTPTNVQECALVNSDTCNFCALPDGLDFD